MAFDDPGRMRDALIRAREQTHALWSDLRDDDLVYPYLDTINPVLWEIGHVGWFQERWVLRHEHGLESLMPGCDNLYDSSTISHPSRWSLPLPAREQTNGYLARILDRVLETLEERPRYVHHLVLFHEDMHDEALTYTRQTLSMPRPEAAPWREPARFTEPATDVPVAGGTTHIGADGSEPFVFDNEKTGFTADVAPFEIADRPVTAGEFCSFVEAGGYERSEYWSDEGWHWRIVERARHPLYWRKRLGRQTWEERVWDRWQPLDAAAPMTHVSAFEADAWCRWAGRRLPTEQEWESAALAGWSGDSPKPQTSSLPNVGQVWEWTADRFRPYPNFAPDLYREYSEPWFATPHRVLRGGSIWTPERMMRPSLRNFYVPSRRDIFSGFRTSPLRPEQHEIET